MAERKQLDYYLEKVVKDGASDLFIVPGSPVSEKIGDQLIPVDGERLMPGTARELVGQIYGMAKREMDSQLQDDDFAFSGKWSRYRVNIYRQRGSLAAVVRVVAYGIPTPEDMHIPSEVVELYQQKDGMILVTGTAGSGKSTTQACIIDQISKKRGGHIITLEDPIEYVHRNNNGDDPEHPDVRSIVSQREVAIDTEDYPSALRACLRQAPDVILLGEMRDRETIQTAITAAETGHLVIATLHTKGAANAVDRIVDAFPGDQQRQIRAQLSMVLRTVVSQQLLPVAGKNGGRVPAYEIMHVKDTPISSLIRDNKSNQIDNTIAHEEGMVSMDQYILDLYKAGTISEDTARIYADNKEWMSRMLNY